MNSKNLMIVILLTLSATMYGQSKQAIYCNSNITWAGELDIDIVVDADSTTDWKAYKVSHLDGFFSQKITSESSQKKQLHEWIMSQVETIQFYEYDSLKYKKEYAALELTDPLYEPENYGDQGGRFPTSAFNVMRLRVYLYYDKVALGFVIEPKAIAVLRPLYDVPSAVIGYDVLGWLPVQVLTEKIALEGVDFEAEVERAIDFKQVRIFKQEWTIEEVMENFMIQVRKKATKIELYDKDWDGILQQIEAEDITKLGMDELLAVRFDEFDPEEQYTPWSGSFYEGLRFSMNWFWKEETFYLKPLFFAPLTPIENGGDVLGLSPVFYKKM